MTSQPINNGPLAFQLNSSGLSTMGNCQVLWPVNDGYNPLNDVKIAQPMVFPADHPTFPGQPKGMKQVLLERGLFRPGLKMKCDKPKCESDQKSCCGLRIMQWQPDFQEQKSLVQETIEAAGHLCIMLPKFHCELNFIEFFWGAVKKYLREHCDYTYY